MIALCSTSKQAARPLPPRMPRPSSWCERVALVGSRSSAWSATRLAASWRRDRLSRRQARRLRSPRRVDAAHHAAAPARARDRAVHGERRAFPLARHRRRSRDHRRGGHPPRPGRGGVKQEELFALRKELETVPEALRAFLSTRRLRLDLAALHPFARLDHSRGREPPLRRAFLRRHRPRGSDRRARRARDHVELLGRPGRDPPALRGRRGAAHAAHASHPSPVRRMRFHGERLAMAEASNPIRSARGSFPTRMRRARPWPSCCPATPSTRSRETREAGEIALCPARRAMVLRRPPASDDGQGARLGPRTKRVYCTGPRDFCEVDLKTVHHWVERGKVPHFRTEGRHLRFRRNDVVRFLRAHEYPLPDALVRARPTVALALGPSSFEGNPLTLDDLAKRLGSRFAVRRHASAAIALAHLLADTPDALVVAHDDATLGFPSGGRGAQGDPALSWIVMVVVAEGELQEACAPRAPTSRSPRWTSRSSPESSPGRSPWPESRSDPRRPTHRSARNFRGHPAKRSASPHRRQRRTSLCALH